MRKTNVKQIFLNLSKQTYNSGFIMYPSGHARNTTADLKQIMSYKNSKMLGDLVFADASVKDQYLSCGKTFPPHSQVGKCATQISKFWEVCMTSLAS